MRTISGLVLLFILFLPVSILVMVRPASSEVTNPSIPEFTLNYIDHSYNVTPTYGTDPYTGKTVMTADGYHVDNRTIEVTIKNQLFTLYKDASGNYTSLYYVFRFKGHYENEWQYYPTYHIESGNSNYPTSPFQSDARGDSYINASSSDYTVVALPLLENVPVGGQMDVQVIALIGHDNRIDWGYGYTTYTFRGESSDWSSTQTVTVGDSSFTTNPTATPSHSPISPTLAQSPTTMDQQQDTKNAVFFGLDWEQIAVIILGITVAVLAFALVLSYKRNTKQTQTLSNASVLK
jgi:hypothetical protein